MVEYLGLLKGVKVYRCKDKKEYIEEIFKKGLDDGSQLFLIDDIFVCDNTAMYKYKHDNIEMLSARYRYYNPSIDDAVEKIDKLKVIEEPKRQTTSTDSSTVGKRKEAKVYDDVAEGITETEVEEIIRQALSQKYDFKKYSEVVDTFLSTVGM